MRRRRVGRPPRLSREQIAATALALVDREGLAALSMRRLARALGASPMTLYGYFSDKDELLAAVVEAATADLRIPPAEGAWRDRLARLMREVRRVVQAHPEAAAIRLQTPLLGRGPLHLTEAAMDILETAGFGRAEAVRAYRALFVFTYGFAVYIPDRAPQVERRTREALLELPPAEFPRLVDAAEEAAATMTGSEPFEWGLQRLLDGLEARL